MLNLEKIKKEFFSGNISHRASDFLGQNIKKFVFLLFFILAGYCGYIWYAYAHNPRWSTEKEADYLKSKNKEVTFDREKFQTIVEKEQERANEYSEKVDVRRDIFRIK